MPTNPRVLLSAIDTCLDQIEERYPGYRDELKSVMADVISMERRHEIQQTNIVQQIRGQCELLGDDIFDHG
jgi:hypothetical protein